MRLFGAMFSVAVAAYITLCGFATSIGYAWSFWHPALVVLVGSVLSAVLFATYEPPPPPELTRDERDVLKRYRDSL